MQALHRIFSGKFRLPILCRLNYTNFRRSGTKTVTLWSKAACPNAGLLQTLQNGKAPPREEADAVHHMNRCTATQNKAVSTAGQAPALRRSLPDRLCRLLPVRQDNTYSARHYLCVKRLAAGKIFPIQRPRKSLVAFQMQL